MSANIGFIIFGILFAWQNVYAGFLYMPDVNESPDIKRESMLRDMDIPPVRDRNPDPESGPRLAVSEFRVQGIVEYPELGITRESISNLVENIRFDMMGEGKLLESGYTIEEISEVSNELVEIEKESQDRHVTPVEVQRLVWLIRDQRSKRGITLGMIETIADKITNYYRERGFILAKAYIPTQEVRDGVVNLTILLGQLGNVKVQGNTLYSTNDIAGVFDDILFKPVTSANIEEKLYLINDYPGLSAQGYFEPGDQVGDTSLIINVKDEIKYNINLRLDNYGSIETGEYRLYADSNINNIFSNADLLHLAYLNTFSPSNSHFGQLSYDTQLFSPYHRLSLTYATNQFDLGPGNVEAINSLRLTGDTKQQEITYKYTLNRSRAKSDSLSLSTSKIESYIDTLNQGTFGGIFDDVVRNNSIKYNFDVLNESSKLLHQGAVSVSSGKFIKGVDLAGEQQDKYYYSNFDYTLLSFYKIPYFDADTRIISKLSIQLADSPLSTINQYNIGGSSRVSAYPINTFSADNALYLGMEWIFNTPDFINFNIMDNLELRNLAQIFVFADAAYGIQYTLDPVKQDENGELADVGFGMKLNYLSRLRGELKVAFPAHNKFSSPDVYTQKDSARLNFELQYGFF